MNKTDTTNRLFFLGKVPILQNKVYANEKSAKAAPCGSLDIRTDPMSGFAVNADYEEQLVLYDREYDNSVPSNAFYKYYDEIADYLEAHYDLTKSIIIDVGCGKGTLLSRMAGRFGFVRGLGIDPAYDGPQTVCDGRVGFIKEYFDAQHVRETPALVLCRHTLEHISSPIEFLKRVFLSLHKEKNVPVFIEVPDLSWIIKNNAFWDFCYEHVNYFTKESLERCIEKTGAWVTKTSSAFGGQYLWAEAIINPNSVPLSTSGRPSEVVAGPEGLGVKRYEATLDHKRLTKHIEVVIRKVKDLCGQKKIVIWGMATKGVMYSLYLFNNELPIAHCVDINTRKQGKYCPLSGYEIISPNNLGTDQEYAVICMNPNYVSEIKEECRRLNLHAQFFDPDMDEIL
jgi:hypothetical protein